MKELLLPCFELGTVSSSPDALVSLLNSSVTGFDRNGMVLYMRPWAHMLNVGLLKLTHCKEKTLLNSLHISKSFAIKREG